VVGHTVGTAAFGGRVQTDDGVEVDGAAPLELGHLGIGDADQPAQLALLEADQPAKSPVDDDGGPPPQLGRQGVPQHLRLRVIAGRAERLAQPRVVLVMAVPAAIPEVVGAAGALPIGMAGQYQAAPGLAGVDPAEGWGGEGHEQPGVPCHRLGDSLAPLEPGGEELVGVGPVGGRTRRAPGLSAGAARLEQHPVRLPLAVVDLPDLARLAVGVLDPSSEADRVMAVAGLGDQLHPALVAGPGPVHDLGQHRRQLVANPGRLGHADSSSTSRSVAVVEDLDVDRSRSARRARLARSRSSSQQERSRTGMPPSWSSRPTPRVAGSMLAAE
jgi:hypothetical protein